jgi:hypothetical protein
MHEASYGGVSDGHRAHRLDGFERQLVEFALAWFPYGGPGDEDTMPEFGLTAEQFRQRCADVVSAGLSDHLDAADHRVVHEAARHLRISPRPPAAVQAVANDGDPLEHWVLRGGVRRWSRTIDARTAGRPM